MGNRRYMFYLNELDPSPKDAQQQLDDIYEDINRKIWDIDDEITYILSHYDHSKNMDNIDSEVISYLQRYGLKISDREPENSELANSDYYLAMYFALETIEYYHSNSESMDYYQRMEQLYYVSKQWGIIDLLSKNKIKVRNTKGQSKGGKVAGENRYKFTRQRAKIEWEKYKRNIPEWKKYIREFSEYENKIEEIIKNFEKFFDNALTGLRLKNSSEENKSLLDEKYTDSTQIPRLAIGWIKEWENLPNKQKEIATQKRLRRKFKDSSFMNIGPRAR